MPVQKSLMSRRPLCNVLLIFSCTIVGCGDWTLPLPNAEPKADAGPDANVEVGQRVELSGLGSSDPDGDRLTFRWQQGVGSLVTLDGANTALCTFLPVEEGLYEFTLTVTDDHTGSDEDTVRILVDAESPGDPPIADAGVDQTVVEGASATLDGRNSADPEGAPLQFRWSQVEDQAPRVSLSKRFTPEPTFGAPEVNADTDLTFELKITDEDGLSDIDTVIITVKYQGEPKPPLCDGVICEDDGDFCNGIESCVSGDCIHGGDPCAANEICNEATDSCDAGPPSGCTSDVQCSDGVYCNGAETCLVGRCTAGALPCEADEDCNEANDSCEPQPACHNNVDCDDGKACTDDWCEGGVCLHEENCADDYVCDPGSWQCVPEPCYNDADCDDGNWCTDDWCDGGLCYNDQIECPSGYYCDENDGQCKPEPCLNNNDCDDGIACTFDWCEDEVCIHAESCPPGQHCDPDGGNCVPEEPPPYPCYNNNECDDGKTCTFDWCEEGVCLHEENCPHGYICGLSSGQCVPDPWLPCFDNEECDDGNDCTSDWCEDQVCYHSENCPTGWPECTPDGCKTCVYDTDCDDAYLCTIDNCVQGICYYDYAPCD